MASVADTFISKGDAIGALDVGVELFLQKLFAGCDELVVQENIKFQLNSLEQNALKAFYTSLPACRNAVFLLRIVQNAGNQPEGMASGYPKKNPRPQHPKTRPAASRISKGRGVVARMLTNHYPVYGNFQPN